MSDHDTDAIALPNASDDQSTTTTFGGNVIRWGFWSALFFGSLLFFTVLKLPEEPVRLLLLGKINESLGPMKLRIDAEKSSLSFWLGPRYTFTQVTLTPIGGVDAKARKLGNLLIAPRFLPLLIGRPGATLSLHQDLAGDLSLGFTKGSSTVQSDLTFDAFDLGKTPILELFAGIQAKGKLDGSINLGFDPLNYASMEGALNLLLTRIEFPPQTLQGFRIPFLAISEGKIRGEMTAGKLVFSEFQIGKTVGTDDLVATGTGEIQAGKSSYGTRIQLKIKLAVSQKVIEAFPLIDGFLGTSKKADGQYSFELSGPISGPSIVPSP